jgi:hypothetical protein
MKPTVSAAILVLALAGTASADRADDDLQAVKRAVGSSPQAPLPAEAPPPATAARANGGELRWFRVRVVDKTGMKARVSVNLPIGLVRSLGDDWPVGLSCRRHRITLGEVLRALDSGQSLFEVDNAEATVRIWID